MRVNVDVRGEPSDVVFLAGPARTAGCLVRIGLLGHDAAGVLQVVIRMVRHTAVAAVVGVRARTIHQLLLTERHQVVTGQRPGRLERTRGGERPAGAARALVFDIRDHVLIAPVDRVGRLSTGRLVDAVLAAALAHAALVECVHLLLGHVGEPVQRHREGLLAGGVLGVVTRHERLVVGVHLHAVQLLDAVAVGLAVGGLEVVPLCVIHEGRGGAQEGGEKKKKLHGDEAARRRGRRRGWVHGDCFVEGSTSSYILGCYQ